jgi:trk system potassium uptake protein
MKIILVGAGEVGTHLCRMLSDQQHDVTLVEKSADRAQAIDEQLNIRVITGSGSSGSLLQTAGIAEADLFLAMTSNDETNLTACSLAHALGAKLVVCRIHDRTYADSHVFPYRQHFGIDVMLNPQALCAVELAKPIRNPARIAVENFGQGRIEVQRFEVAATGRGLGQPLRSLKLPPGTRIGLVERAGVSEVPGADSTLQAGDWVTVFGSADNVAALRLSLDPSTGTARTRIAILGGGETALALCRLLRDRRFAVRVIEHQAAKCRQLAELLPQVTVIHGDGTSLRLLEEEQIGACDFFIAATGDDERNILAGVQAGKLGARHVQCVLHKPDYETIFGELAERLRLQRLMSPRLVTAQEVARYLSTEPLIELFRFANDGARLVELAVAPGSAACGKPLRDLTWPQRTVAVGLFHHHDVSVPTADDQLAPGDRLVLLTHSANHKEIVRMFR